MTRRQDEELLAALALLSNGASLAEAAKTIGRASTNLRNSLRAIMADDCLTDGPSVLAHYPPSIRMTGV